MSGGGFGSAHRSPSGIGGAADGLKVSWAPPEPRALARAVRGGAWARQRRRRVGKRLGRLR
eukprot:605595-Alexandrium_andersonii.AAC.1